MAFLKENNRKTSSAISTNDVNLTSIDLKNKLITDGEHTANFQRLLYKGCPVLPIEGRRAYNPKNQPAIIDANRKSLAVKICNTIHGMDKTKRTKINIFRETVSFIRMLDSEGIENIACPDSVTWYINELVKLYKKGVKGKSLSSRQNSLKALIKELDIGLYRQCKDIFIVFPSDNEPTRPYTDDELNKTASALYIIFNDYAKHIENDTVPLIFPLYNARNKDGSYKFESKGLHIRHTSHKCLILSFRVTLKSDISNGWNHVKAFRCSPY